MDNKKLKEIESALKTNAVEIRENADYVDGKNPFILNQVQPKGKPDHRVATPLAKMAVDDMTGYAGRPGDRQTIIKNVGTENESKDDPFLDYVRAMEAYNKEQIETSELFEESCSQGVAYEIFWTSDGASLPDGTLTTEYKIVPTESIYIQWSNDIKPIMEYFVYFSGDDKEMVASVYYPLYREDWVSMNGSKFILQPDIVEYPFTEPPLNIFPLNRKEKPLFEAGKSLIDSYDLIVSRSMNEVERFNGLIMILAERASEEFTEAVQQGEISVIDDQADNAGGTGVARSDLPRYLQKDFSGINELYTNTLDRLNEDYRKTVKIPDMADKSFAGQQSGVSQAYKLLGMEFMAAKIDTYFDQGLAKRLDFYIQAYNAGTEKVSSNEYKAEVKSKRNLPVNMLEIVQAIVQLRGIISDETILEYLPRQIVPDVKKEIERLKTQEPENVLGLEGDGIQEGADLSVIEDADVTAIALNGAQIQAAASIAEKVAAGELTRESGLQLVMALGIPREQAEKIVPPEGSRRVEV